MYTHNIYIYKYLSILIYTAEEFVCLNLLISGTTAGSNWKIIFVLDSTFRDGGYRI